MDVPFPVAAVKSIHTSSGVLQVIAKNVLIIITGLAAVCDLLA